MDVAHRRIFLTSVVSPSFDVSPPTLIGTNMIAFRPLENRIVEFELKVISLELTIQALQNKQEAESDNAKEKAEWEARCKVLSRNFEPII
jgi:hypothetical protein